MHSFTFADQEARQQYRLIKRLADDLDRIRLGMGPSPDEITQAPFITDWMVGVRAEPALLGNVSGHPMVDGHALTSPLFVLDPANGYARTLTRFYRIGKPL